MGRNQCEAGPVLNSQEQQEVHDTLARFIRDFNNFDMDIVASYFADDATLFPRTFMSDSGTADMVLTDYCREDGPGPFKSLEKFAAELSAQSSGPPYMNLEPADTEIQVFGETAIVTFHLHDPGRHARRTFIFIKRNNDWKIIHLHASNVQINS